ncbi:MAG: hypothetical protein AAF330_01625 [Pseudomonadota bacterium]
MIDTATGYGSMARQDAIGTLEAQGLSLELSGYDERLVQEVAALKGRVGPEVRCCGDEDSSEKAMLLALRADEELVGFAALKLCDFGDRTLAEYLWETYRQQYSGGADPFDLEDLPSLVKTVRGRVVYYGDFWVQSARKINKTALAIVLLSIAHRDFEADYSYFFTRFRNYRRGLGAHYLATCSIPFAINWAVDVEHRLSSDTLYFTSREEAFRLERKFVMNPIEFS